MSLLWLAGCDFMRDFEGRWYEGHPSIENITEEEVVLLTLPDLSETGEWVFPKHMRYMMFRRPNKADMNRLIMASFVVIPSVMDTIDLQVGKSYKIRARFRSTSQMAVRSLCELSPDYFICNKGYDSIMLGFYDLFSIEPIP